MEANIDEGDWWESTDWQTLPLPSREERVCLFSNTMKDQKQFTRRIAELVLHRGPSGTSRVCLDTDQQGFRVYDTCDENLTRPGDSWDERLSTLDEALDSMLVCSHAVIYFDILGGNTMKEEKDQAERKDSDELIKNSPP